MTQPRRDYSHHVQHHRSPSLRVLFIVLGSLCVALGIAGIFLPVLPTTPFMLLAAAFYARASSRFYNWLVNTPAFGPAILEWREYRAIPYRIKWIAISLIIITFAISVIYFSAHPYLPWGLLLLGAGLVLWLWRIPSRDGPATRCGGAGDPPR